MKRIAEDIFFFLSMKKEVNAVDALLDSSRYFETLRRNRLTILKY